jgi:tetratricopeptide (TPR) repeat protein
MSSVRELHDKAAKLAQRAIIARHEGEAKRSEDLALQACVYETQAAMLVPHTKDSEPTRSILYLSAASLAYQCKEYRRARNLITQGLSGYPPPSVKQDLEGLHKQVSSASSYPGLSRHDHGTIIILLPPGLSPAQLMCQLTPPPLVAAIMGKYSEHRERGDMNAALRWAKQAQVSALASNDAVSESIANVCIADTHREMGQPGLAYECCQKAIVALRLRPTYEHRTYAEAVVTYLQGLLRQAQGDNLGALAAYQQSATLFERASEYWESQTADTALPSEACRRALKWIVTLCRVLVDTTSAGGKPEPKVLIAVYEGEGYDFAYLEMEGLFLQAAVIGNKKYKLYPDPLMLDLSLSCFLMRVPEDHWAGPYSGKGDYFLITQMPSISRSEGIGSSQFKALQQWEYSTFLRDPVSNIRFQPTRTVIGGESRDLMIPIGVLRESLTPG